MMPLQPTLSRLSWIGWLFFLLSAASLVFACDPPTSSLCTQDSDCTAGKICRQSRCEAIQTRCQTDNDCKTSETCQNSYCKPLSPACQADKDCTAGKICLRQICQTQFCTDDRNCLPTEVCVSGACSPKSEAPTETPKAEPPPKNDGGPTDSSSEPLSDSLLPETPKDNAPITCTPNRDGSLQRDELTFRIGSSVVYTSAGSSSNPISVDLRGTPQANGDILWDFSSSYPSQIREVDEILPIQGSWFESSFTDPLPSYASILDRTPPSGSTSIPLGIYRTTPDAVEMLGFVSQQPNAYTVTYKTPPALLRFPLSVGTKWKAEVSSSGTFGFVAYSASETYDFEVDAKGTIKLPLGPYPVLRLRLRFTQQLYLPTLFQTTRISYFFLSECVGIVAKIDSKAYESNLLFDKAARIRRLAD